MCMAGQPVALAVGKAAGAVRVWKDFKSKRHCFGIRMYQRTRHGIRRQDTAKNGDCVLGMPGPCEHGAMIAVAKHDVAGSEAE